jgi:Flp pilus assembly protein TadG
MRHGQPTIAQPRPGASRARSARRGTTAVEFGVLAFPFLVLLTGLVDTGLTFWASQTLDDALVDTARSIQIGQFQASNQGVTDTTVLLANLRTQFCQARGKTRPTIFDCPSVKLEVQTFASVAAGTARNPLDAATRGWTADFGTRYANAGASTIVVVQAAVKYPTWFNMLGITPTFSDGSRLLQSVLVFRTEPF